MSRLDELGREIPDGSPLTIPSGFRRPPTLEEQIHRLLFRQRLNDAAALQGKESFEDANDFDIEDDPVDPNTPYEPFFDPFLGREVTPQLVRKHEEELRVYTQRMLDQHKEAQERDKPPAATPPAAPPASPPET